MGVNNLVIEDNVVHNWTKAVNIPEAMVAFLAVISLGGVWSICAPDMGTNAVLDRFKQIEPKVLIACDGVSYGGRDFDRGAAMVAPEFELQAMP